MRSYKKELEEIANDLLNQNADAKGNENKPNYSKRDFMNAIQAGCSSPVGAITTIEKDEVHFTGLLISLDGKQKAILNKSIQIDNSKGFGVICANEMKANHQQLINDIKLDLNNL